MHDIDVYYYVSISIYPEKDRIYYAEIYSIMIFQLAGTWLRPMFKQYNLMKLRICARKPLRFTVFIVHQRLLKKQLTVG